MTDDGAGIDNDVRHYWAAASLQSPGLPKQRFLAAYQDVIKKDV